MLTDVVKDFVEDVGEGWLAFRQGVTQVLLVFSQALLNRGGREHVGQGVVDQGANEMPAIGDILGFPPHSGNNMEGGGGA